MKNVPGKREEIPENSELFSKKPLLFSGDRGIIQVIYCRLYKRLGSDPRSFLLKGRIL
jgi:hypothetical protein